MRLIGFILIVFLSLSVAYLLGAAGPGVAVNFLILAVLIGGANYFLSRRMCFRLAGVSLFLGVLVPAGVWTYASMFIKGDSSGYGMLGTLLAFVFMPIGLGLVLLGWCKD